MFGQPRPVNLPGDMEEQLIDQADLGSAGVSLNNDVAELVAERDEGVPCSGARMLLHRHTELDRSSSIPNESFEVLSANEFGPLRLCDRHRHCMSSLNFMP